MNRLGDTRPRPPPTRIPSAGEPYNDGGIPAWMVTAGFIAAVFEAGVVLALILRWIGR